MSLSPEALMAAMVSDPSLALEIEAEAASRHLMDFARFMYPEYVFGRVHECLAGRLEEFSQDVTAGRSPKLVICVPPGLGKSTFGSVLLPLWHLGHNPTHGILEVANVASNAHRFSRMVIKHLQGERIKLVFPGLHTGAKATEPEWDTSLGGTAFYCGVDGGILSRRANMVIEDDLYKSFEAADSPAVREDVKSIVTTDAPTRIKDGGGELLIGQRLNVNDIMGEQIKSGWPCLVLPARAEAADPLGRAPGEALWPEKFDEGRLAGLEKSLGPFRWAAMFQQRPEAPGGAIFKREWFPLYDEAQTPTFSRVIQSWDPTFGSQGDGASWVVGQVWGQTSAPENAMYLLAESRFQGGFLQQVEAIKAMSESFPNARTILIEKKADGAAIIEMLKRDRIPAIPNPSFPEVNPKESKELRAIDVTGEAKAGKIRLPRRAAWTNAVLDEWCSFSANSPAANDRVDAMSQAVKWARRQRAYDYEAV